MDRPVNSCRGEISGGTIASSSKHADRGLTWASSQFFPEGLIRVTHKRDVQKPRMKFRINTYPHNSLSVEWVEIKSFELKGMDIIVRTGWRRSQNNFRQYFT